jgi:hypothetical protein
MGTKELYSTKYKFKYYHIPKNGITSILRVCINDNEIKNSISSNWVNVDSLPEDTKTICVLRDPYKRFISGYLQGKELLGHYLSHKNIDPMDKLRFGLCREVSDDLLRKIYGTKDTLTGMKILLNEMNTNGNLEHHTMRQVDFVNYKGRYYNTKFNIYRDVDDVDIFLNHDTITNDIKMVHGDIKLPHLNKKSNEVAKEAASKIKDDILYYYEKDMDLYTEKILNEKSSNNTSIIK